MSATRLKSPPKSVNGAVGRLTGDDGGRSRWRAKYTHIITDLVEFLDYHTDDATNRRAIEFLMARAKERSS